MFTSVVGGHKREDVMLRSKYGKVDYRKEIIGVLVAGGLVFLALSLLSFNVTDSSWFYFSSEHQAVTNWCGIFGAYTSSLFLFLFGSSSYLLVLTSVFLLVKAFKNPSFFESRLCISMLPLLIFSSCALLHIHNFDFIVVNPGGLVGELLAKLFLPILGSVGSFFFFYLFFCMSILVFAEVSFLRFGMVLLEGCLQGLRYVARSCAEVVIGSFAYLFKRGTHEPKIERSAPIEKNVATDQLIGALAGLAKKAEPCSFNYPLIRVRAQKKKVLGRFDITFIRNTMFDEKLFLSGRFNTIIKRLAEYKNINRPEVSSYIFPVLQDGPRVKSEAVREDEYRERGKRLEEKLLRFGVKGNVVAIRPGPVITLFEYKPEIDSKISKIVALEDDLAMALTAVSIRIIAPIPGRNVVGFEISNQTRQDVFLSDVMKTAECKNDVLPLALGVDSTGKPVVQDLLKMPHVLVAGSTGSGKSVGLNSMIVSLLCCKRPDELKFILIDPKRLEFAPYADIPHLLFPIITNPRKAVPILKWVVQEMEDRYDMMAKEGVRSISDYHRLCQEKSGLVAMPFMVIVIDELADLMIVAGKDVETYIARIAQMARAAGIHMIVATQRPSVDVLTGVIKVNFPARMAFRVSSKIDSRTILDSSGAEKLLGRGDMLFLSSGSSSADRVHGAYVSTKQITDLADSLRAQQRAEYLDINEELRREGEELTDVIEDELYGEIKNFITSVDEVSISLLQRRYRIGFNRSARLIEQLERDGVVAPQQGGKMRKVVR